MKPSFLRQRRRLLAAAGMGALATLLPSAQTWGQSALANSRGRHERLLFAGPPAPVSFPLMRLASNSELLTHLNRKVEFKLWNTPDQLRALVMQASVDFIALPTHVAANLYNQNAPIRLMDVSTWGLLWIVSRDREKRTLTDFRGEEIIIPLRADTPDILFQYLARQQGLNPEQDFRLRYVGSPFEAMQLLLTRRSSHALLSEPAVSMALYKTRTFPVTAVAPTLYRSVDLQQEWARLLKRPPQIPMAGIAALGAARADTQLLSEMEQALAYAHAWCRTQPLACGSMAKRHASMLISEAVADALEVIPDTRRRASYAQAELEFFYSQLLQHQAEIIGEQLPDNDFYI